MELELDFADDELLISAPNSPELYPMSQFTANALDLEPDFTLTAIEFDGDFELELDCDFKDPCECSQLCEFFPSDELELDSQLLDDSDLPSSPTELAAALLLDNEKVVPELPEPLATDAAKLPLNDPNWTFPFVLVHFPLSLFQPPLPLPLTCVSQFSEAVYFPSHWLLYNLLMALSPFGAPCTQAIAKGRIRNFKTEK